MSAVAHGGVASDELAALGLDAAEVLDLSANLHPFGAHAAVLAAAREAELCRYPEPHALTLRAAIAAQTQLAPEQILITPGATAAIHLAARALVRPGDACVLWPPTFGEYEVAVRNAGGHILALTTEPPAFAPAREVATAPLAMLCNPNNPTGVYLAREEVATIARQLRGTLVLDVAYDPFVEGAWDADMLVRDGHDVVVAHSLTKLHATPGLRVGFVTGPAARIARMAALQPSWSVGAVEQAAAFAMLAHDAEQRRGALSVAPVRETLTLALRELGLEVCEGRANFVLARVGDAAAFRGLLLRRCVAVRDCTSFGLPEWVRLAVPAPHDLARVLTAVRAALGERP